MDKRLACFTYADDALGAEHVVWHSMLCDSLSSHWNAYTVPSEDLQ